MRPMRYAALDTYPPRRKHAPMPPTFVPTIAMLRLPLCALLMAAAGATAPVVAAENRIPVEATNKSEPVACAEKDNVDLEFTSREVAGLRIQAAHPAYAGMLRAPHDLPDFSGCTAADDPKLPTQAEQKKYTEERVTFWENSDFWLVGYRHSSFWRPANVPLKVGNRVEQGFDIVQLWARDGARAEQVLVVYPPDGYWRIRPLSPANMQWTSYGSSFLLGPIEIDKRPIVVLTLLACEPDARTFVLTFARGGTARVKITSVDNDRIILDAGISGPVPRDLPFLAMRSMYTNEGNADVARVAWRVPGGLGWNEAPVMTFAGGKLTELWAGRTNPSGHNISAPDMIFGPFTGTAVPASR